MPAEVRFGRYELLQRIAIGGMAELFLARFSGEAGFQKTCVVKRVLPHLAARPKFVQMFLDEARLAARLDHPGIVQIFDLGRVDDDYFLAMEYLAGEDVAALLEKSDAAKAPVPIDVAVRIIALAAEALHYAHEAVGDDGRPLNIVHRDVSPSNLFVTYQGAVKVLDFGIARAASQTQHTETGQLKGKVSYMPPEQIRREGVDRRADVWALGVCLHELLTGQRLFRGESMVETALMVCDGELAPPSRSRPDVPPELDALVMRTLERAPSRRCPDARALAQDLQRFLAQRTASIDLGTYLQDLFGADHVEARRALGPPTPNPGAAAPAGTAQLTPGPGVVVPAKPVPAADERPRTASVTAPSGKALRRRSLRRSLAALGVLAATAAAGFALLRPDPSSTGPSPGAVAEPGPLPSPSPDALPPGQPPPPGAGGPEATAPATTAAGPAAANAGQTARASRTEPRVLRGGAVRGGATGRSRGAERGGRTSSRAATALLTVRANVPARVLVDGKAVGTTPLVQHRLPPGPHKLQVVSRELGLSRSWTVRVEAERELTEAVEFHKGRLNVIVDPWADVWLDGVRIGQTPLAGKEVWEGRRTLRLVGPSGEKSLTVDIRPGETRVVKEQLP